MTTDNVLREICLEMSPHLDEEQLQKLQNILYINFNNKKIVDESYELMPVEEDNDYYKMKMFDASKKISGRQATTIKQYLDEVNKLRFAVNKTIPEITTMDIRWYLAIKQERDHISLVTVQSKIRYLNSFFKFLHEEGYIPTNPVARIEPIRLEYVLKKEFSPREIEALRESCECLRDRAMMEFLLNTGVRVAELCSLNVGDFDFTKQEFVVMGKGRKERRLYLCDSACYHLEEYMKERCAKVNGTLEDIKSEPMFTALKKPYNRLTIAGVQYLLKRIGKKAEVDDVHPHRFRRTFATNLLAKDMRIEEVMVLMGHTKIETTMIYSNINQDNVKNSYHKYVL